MANILIVLPQSGQTEMEKHVAEKLSTLLIAKGHLVSLHSSFIGPTSAYGEKSAEEATNTIIENVKKYDGLLVLINTKSQYPEGIIWEMQIIRSYLKINPSRFFFPVILDKAVVPSLLNDLPVINISMHDLNYGVEEIQKAIFNFLGKRKAIEEKQEETREKIEKNVTVFITEATRSLVKRENENKWSARFCYIIGFLALIAGIIAALIGFGKLPELKEVDNIWLYVIVIIKSTIITGLLIASSKYAYDLGNSFMHDALKNADRLHAISFGKFYLEAYGNNGEGTTSKEIMELFQHWNIDSSTSSFSKLDSNKIDIKVLEKVFDTVKILSDKVKSEK